MNKPWHGSQYPVNRQIDRANRFGAECLYAFTFPNGDDGDAWEAVNGMSVPKGGTTLASLDTAPLGVGINCSNPGDASRDHGYPIPAGIQYTTGATENFVVSFYGSALDGSFLNFIGDETTSSTMRFRSSGGDTFLAVLSGGSTGSIPTASGLTGVGSDVHLFTVIIDHDANFVRLYADGVLEGSVFIGDEGFVFADLLMGFNATGYGWSGYIQEIQVFLTPTPWTAADVSAHHDNMFQIYETDIIYPYLVSSPPAVAPSGRIMSSMTGYGGLAGMGGIAGQGGGLAG